MAANSFKKILTYSAAIVSVAAAVVMIFDFWDRIEGLFGSSSNEFASENICTWEHCIKDNQKFIEFIESNVGKTVELNVLLDITTGAGDFQSRCYEDLVLQTGWDAPEGEGHNVIAVLPNFDSCKPEGRALISYRDVDKLEAQAITGTFEDRLYGTFIITLRHWGGPALFEFQKL